MLQTNNSKLELKKPKKQFRKKLILYLTLILILIILVAIGYFKLNKYLNLSFNTKPNYVSSFSNYFNKLSENESLEVKDINVESKYINILNEYLQKQSAFQNELNKKILDLENNIRISSSNAEEKSIFLSKIANLEQQIVLLNNKKEYVKNFTTIYSFILALRNNLPFLLELNAFASTNLDQKFIKESNYLQTVAAKGIPSSYDLAYELDSLFPIIKTEIYKLDKTSWGIIKYYISLLFVVQKERNFALNDNSIDKIVFDIKCELLDNSAENALSIFEKHNLHHLPVLESWYMNLNYRVKANILATKLQQYLLNANSGK